MGLLLADGHFSKTGTISLSLTDKEHIEMFCDFLHIPKEKITCRKGLLDHHKDVYGVTKTNTSIVKQIKEKYGIDNRKSYNGFRLIDGNRDMIYALICGFIDGDGNIKYQTGRSDCLLQIQLHSSGYLFLNDIIDFIYNTNEFENLKKPKILQFTDINGWNAAKLNITNNLILKYLKNKAIELNLPIMKRKWDKINTDFIGRIERGKITRKNVYDLYLQNKYTHQEIADKVGIARSYVSRIIKWCNENKPHSSYVNGYEW